MSNYQELVTPTGRFSHIHLAEKTQYMKNTPSYNATLLLPKNCPECQKFVNNLLTVVIPECARAKWGANVNPATYQHGLKDGDVMECGLGLDSRGDVKPGYAGHWFIMFKESNKMPYLCDADRKILHVAGPMGSSIPDMSRVKSGDYGKMHVTIAAVEGGEQKKRWVGGYLIGVMVEREGEALSGGGGSRGEINPIDVFGPADHGAVPPVAQQIQQPVQQIQQPAYQQPVQQLQQPVYQQPVQQVQQPAPQAYPAPPSAGWGAPAIQ